MILLNCRIRIRVAKLGQRKKNNTILKGKETEAMARLKQKYKNCNVTYTVKNI